MCPSLFPSCTCPSTPKIEVRSNVDFQRDFQYPQTSLPFEEDLLVISTTFFSIISSIYTNEIERTSSKNRDSQPKESPSIAAMVENRIRHTIGRIEQILFLDAHILAGSVVYILLDLAKRVL